MDALRQLTYITNLEQKIEDLNQINDDLAEELNMLYALKVTPPQRRELVGGELMGEAYTTNVEYSKLKSSLLGLILKYNQKLTLKTRFAFDRWYDFAAEENEGEAYQRMPTLLKEALDPSMMLDLNDERSTLAKVSVPKSRMQFDEPFGPHSQGNTGLFNVQGDRDGVIFESSSDDDRLELAFHSDHNKRTHMKIIGQCTDLVQTVLKQCAVRMVTHI